VTALPSLLHRLRERRIVDDVREQALVRDGILTLPDLDLAVMEERPSVADAALRRAAATLRDEQRQISLGRAWELLESLMTAMTRHCLELDTIEPAGDVRRAEPLVSALVLAVRSANPREALAGVGSLAAGTEILYRTARRAVLTWSGHEVDVRVAPPDEYGSLLFTTTGPAAHVVEIQKRRGPRLSASETDVYTQAGLAYLPPETRDTPDALDIAARPPIPRLVQREDMRGDLHLHSTYSDGRDSLRRMVRAARTLGYEYIAITDHSQHSGASRTVTPADLSRQRDEIQRLREEVPDMAILHGLEVDIMPDGRLDCPDQTLASLDIVLASLHDAAGQRSARLTERCLAAIRHPLVSVITHPANQLIGHRPGHDMDYGAIYAAAAETGTALEIDGAPSHLDLSGERAREAVRAGATLVIDSDCHRAPSLDRQMRMGVGTARRGWVESRHVLNTGPIHNLLAFIARKRRG
jgi:DNA polymerase (family 10)